MARTKKSYNDKELEKILKTVAKNITIQRELTGLSQNKLSRLSGIALSTINEIENLKAKDIRLSTLTSLARKLDTSPLKLLHKIDIDVNKQVKKEFSEAISQLEKLKKLL